MTLDGQLVAGVTFTRFRSPESEEEVIWLNALFVKPLHRGHGLASKLLDQAVSVVASAGSPVLFAYTKIPRLYLHHGWSEVSAAHGHNVLKISTSRPST